MSATMLQLDPPIPMKVIPGDATQRHPAGDGIAYGWLDTGFDHNVVWGVCMDATGEWWWLDNVYVRGYPNPTYGALRTVNGVKA